MIATLYSQRDEQDITMLTFSKGHDMCDSTVMNQLRCNEGRLTSMQAHDFRAPFSCPEFDHEPFVFREIL